METTQTAKQSLIRKLVGDRAFYKMVLAIAVPIMIQNGITNFVSLLDNIMIGQIGTEQMSGVEWTFLHCIESVFKPEAMEDYRNLIEKCNSDLLKDMLVQRLQNYIDSTE